MTARNSSVGPTCVAVLLSTSAQASNYRFGATHDRVVSDEAHGYTQHITPDFEVQDGVAVTYVRLGHARVARLVATDYAAKVYTDVAPLDGADGKITAGDAWIAQQAQNGALSLPLTPTAVERLLLSGARRILYESVPTMVYFAHDQLGSLTVETDDQGGVVGRRAYATWGAERAASGDGDSYGFTGQRQDDGGTVHFSFRQLDPATGRWSSTDPLFHLANPDLLDAFGEATTSYAYVANNPSNRFDPTGLELLKKPSFSTRLMARMGVKRAQSTVRSFNAQQERRAFLLHTNEGHEQLLRNAQALRQAARGLEAHSQNLPAMQHQAWMQGVEGDLKRVSDLQNGIRSDLELLGQSNKIVEFPERAVDRGALRLMEAANEARLLGAAAREQAHKILPGRFRELEE
jgi:RHS repeat-associated protein